MTLRKKNHGAKAFRRLDLPNSCCNCLLFSVLKSYNLKVEVKLVKTSCVQAWGNAKRTTHTANQNFLGHLLVLRDVNWQQVEKTCASLGIVSPACHRDPTFKGRCLRIQGEKQTEPEAMCCLRIHNLLLGLLLVTAKFTAVAGEARQEKKEYGIPLPS